MKDNDRPFNLIPNNHHNFEEILNFQFSKMSPYSSICPNSFLPTKPEPDDKMLEIHRTPAGFFASVTTNKLTRV